MQRMTKLLANASVMALIAGAAVANMAEPSISNLPDKGMVTVSGTVEKVENERAFRLRDNTGAIEVKVTSGESVVLKQGDSVTVSGQIENLLWGLMGKDINATGVEVHKDLPTALSDAVTKTTGITMDKAENVRIGKLPAQGMVQITGIVDKVSDQKNFTLKDTTGAVDVSIQSDENVVLAKGAEVTVTGYVNNGILGKKIRATHVILLSNAPADTGHMNAGVN